MRDRYSRHPIVLAIVIDEGFSATKRHQNPDRDQTPVIGLDFYATNALESRFIPKIFKNSGV